MRKKHLIFTTLTFFLMMFSATRASAQFVLDSIQKQVVLKKPQHLLGVKYNVGYGGANFSIDVKEKKIVTTKNMAFMYTYYHPMWGYMDNFGIQTGIKYGQEGFDIDVEGTSTFGKTPIIIDYIEVPFLSHFKIDFGNFRALMSIGGFGAYRISTTKDNGFDCFDNRWDYGAVGGLGFGYVFKPFEIQIEGQYRQSLNMLYHPEVMNSEWWLYSYPSQFIFSIALYIHL